MTSHGAIQTEYKGYQFRSRLEARWAVFFDHLGIEWTYEDQGYEVEGHRYLPDFWLPRAHCWVEVKGDPDGLRKEHRRMCAILGANSPLRGFVAGHSALIVLGEIPAENHDGTVMHPVLHRRDAALLSRTWGCFMPLSGGSASFSYDRSDSLLYFFLGRHTTGSVEEPSSSAWSVDAWPLRSEMVWPKLNEAYRAARGARFEHGEHGESRA
jgi:hypothetical protein